jgi:pimeloyl-ACP methyl ester carboxylesterase
VGKLSALALCACACAHVERARLPAMLVKGPAGALRASDGGPALAALPVVFVHGLAENLDAWEPQLLHLRSSRRAIAFDFRGHGQSADSADASIEALAGDLAAIVEKFELQRFVLVARSLGAPVAETYAAAHPERVAGMLLVDPSGDLRKAPDQAAVALLATLRGPDFSDYEERYVVEVGGRDAAVKERALAAASEARKPALAGWFESALRFDPVAALARYPGPVLIVWSPSSDVPYSLARLQPSVPQREFPAGHWMNLERPDEFDAILDQFLQKAEGAR